MLAPFPQMSSLVSVIIYLTDYDYFGIVSA